MKASVAIRHARGSRGARRATASPQVVMLWTTDEEVGSGTSRALIEEEAGLADAVLVMEPSLPGGACKTGRKGCGEFRLTARGISAHAGIDPRQGASAIHELARQILEVEKLRDPERGISVNVGVISGAPAPNVVAETAAAVIDVRVPSAADARRVEDQLARPRGTSIQGWRSRSAVASNVLPWNAPQA